VTRRGTVSHHSVKLLTASAQMHGDWRAGDVCDKAALAVFREATLNGGGNDLLQDGLDLIGAHRLREQHAWAAVGANANGLAGLEDQLFAFTTPNGSHEPVDWAQHQFRSSSAVTLNTAVALTK
jgi:hypothetical protein